MPLNVTPDQKSLIESLDSEIETAFSEGVSESTLFLDPLPGYNQIPANNKAQGREGILSTFASLIKRLGAFRPTIQGFSLANGFFAWPDPRYRAPSYYIEITGDVSLTGLLSHGTGADAFVAFATLPVEARPDKKIFMPAIKSDNTTVQLEVNPDGQIWFRDTISAGDIISLDGIRFMPTP